VKLQKQYDAQQRVTHVKIIETGTVPEQVFSDRLVVEGLLHGWVKMDLDERTIVMKADPEDLRFELLAVPGYYCVSTGERIPISQIAWDRMRSTGQGDLSYREAQAWLKANGKGTRDYRVNNGYEVRLGDEQHQRFKAAKHVSGSLVAAYLLEAAEG